MSTQGQDPNQNPPFTSCAACEDQQNQCPPDCPFRPFFPAGNAQEFLNAKALYGVKNMTTIAESIAHPDREIAIRSMILEANARANDPVGGCFRVIAQLLVQFGQLQTQYEQCQSELLSCKDQIQYLLAQIPNSNVGVHNQFNGNLNLENFCPQNPNFSAPMRFDNDPSSSSGQQNVFNGNFMNLEYFRAQNPNFHAQMGFNTNEESFSGNGNMDIDGNMNIDDGDYATEESEEGINPNFDLNINLNLNLNGLNVEVQNHLNANMSLDDEDEDEDEEWLQLKLPENPSPSDRKRLR